MSKTSADIGNGIETITRTKLLILTITLSLVLSNCSIKGLWPYRSDFDCPISEGQKCKSLYEINKMADEGKFGPNAVDSLQDMTSKKNSKKSICKKQCKMKKGSNDAC